MTKEELLKLQKEGKIIVVNVGDDEDKSFSESVKKENQQNTLQDFIGILQVLKTPKQHLVVAPDFVPRTFVDQIQVYDDGTNRRIYIYVNKTWRYVNLT